MRGADVAPVHAERTRTLRACPTSGARSPWAGRTNWWVEVSRPYYLPGTFRGNGRTAGREFASRSASAPGLGEEPEEGGHPATFPTLSTFGWPLAVSVASHLQWRSRITSQGA